MTRIINDIYIFTMMQHRFLNSSENLSGCLEFTTMPLNFSKRDQHYGIISNLFNLIGIQFWHIGLIIIN